MEKKNVFWINAVKAICMISVYIVHSEIYYWGKVTYGTFLIPFYVNAFFYISGYLFFRKFVCVSDEIKLQTSAINGGVNILFKLVIPTIIFSTFIYVPKIIFHGRDLNIQQYFYDVWGGCSYWFTSTLAIAQIILLSLLFLRKKICLYVTFSIFLLIGGIILKNISSSPFPWYYKSAMGAVFFMALGGVYQKYEMTIDEIIRKSKLVFLCFVYLILLLFDYKAGSAKCIVMDMDINMFGIIVSILGIISIVGIAKLLPVQKYVAYIGKNSIVYYFFSGVFPAAIGSACLEISIGRMHIVTLCVAIISLLISTFIVWGINTYFPFLLDLREHYFLRKEK